MKVLKSSGAFEGKPDRVFIAIPTTDNISPETVFSLFGAKEELLKNDIESEMAICAYDCHVDDQRNTLVQEFLESKCNTFVFIDSDLHFDPEDLVKLIRYDRDVVAGVYPKKAEERQFPVMLLDGPMWTDEDGLLEVYSVPTGFLKIKRKVLELLYISVPKYASRQDVGRKIRTPLIFERKLDGNVRWGGDYEFCQKWKKTGGKIFVDPNMRFSHIGSTEYFGSLGHHLRLRNGLVDAHMVGIIRKVQSSTEDVNDYCDLFESWENKWTPPVPMLATVAETARQVDGKILEIGSGLTTLLLGASGNEVTSLEHDPEWANKIGILIDKCGYDNIEVVERKLVDGWYDFEIEETYSMVLIDGPPRISGDRMKIVDKLNSVSDDCIFIVDDVDSGLDMTPALAEKFGINFLRFGRFAVGRKQ